MVRRLMIRGVKSATEIQKALAQNDPPIKLTVRTIYRYTGIISKRTTEEARRKVGINQTVEEIALKLKAIIEEVSKEAWRQYHAPATMNIKCPHCDDKFKMSMDFGMLKIQALRLITDNAKDWTKTLQSLGLVNTAPIQHQLLDKDGNPTDPISLPSTILNQQFNSFIKSQFQDPIGIVQEEPKPVTVPEAAQG